METKIFQPGTILIKENETSRVMYIIKSGTAKVFKTHYGKKINLAKLGPGEIFGELSFLDAKPRSASIIVTTEMEAIVLDGTEVADKADKLPEWVRIILKSVFFRFREMDQRIAVLQSFGDGKKKPENEHLIEAMILHKEMEDVLGDTLFGIKSFLTVFIENHLLEVDELNGKAHFTMDKNKFNEFKKYIERFNNADKLLILSSSAIAVLREMASHLTENQNSFDPKEYQFKEIPLYEQAVEELIEKGLIKVEEDIFHFENKQLLEHFHCQSIIKNFDQSSLFKK